MKKFKVAVIVGSLRKDSHNLKLAKSILKLGSEKLEAHISVIADLPLYNQDLDNQFPEQAVRLKKEIENADAVLFVTPEYNRSVPGILKNAIDLASRPYGKNSFAKKTGCVVRYIGWCHWFCLRTKCLKAHTFLFRYCIDGSA